MADYDNQQLAAAVKRILIDGESQRQVSRETHIPQSTLSDKIKLIRQDIKKQGKPVGDGSIADDPDGIYERVLFISDQHAPYTHPDALDFLAALDTKYRFDLIVNLGDELDYHAMSFHDSDPDLDSAGPELERGREWLQNLHDLFPAMHLVESNHGSMKYRKAKHHGVPRRLLLSYRAAVFGEKDGSGDIYYPDDRGKGWRWHDELTFETPLEPVTVQHGGAKRTESNILDNRSCYVQGHFHEDFNIVYLSTKRALLWGMTAGCLIDKKSYAFAYNKTFKKRPIIGCGGCFDGLPRLFPMPLNRAGRWTGQTP